MKTANNNWLERANKIKEAYKLRQRPTEFINLNSAIRWCENLYGSYKIVMGENLKYWIVTSADAARLAKYGFECVNF
jgi:hypothetical protein